MWVCQSENVLHATPTVRVCAQWKTKFGMSLEIYTLEQMQKVIVRIWLKMSYLCEAKKKTNENTKNEKKNLEWNCQNFCSERFFCLPLSLRMKIMYPLVSQQQALQSQTIFSHVIVWTNNVLTPLRHFHYMVAMWVMLQIFIILPPAIENVTYTMFFLCLCFNMNSNLLIIRYLERKKWIPSHLPSFLYYSSI